MNDQNTDKLNSIIDSSKTVLIMQADNPDSDSLGSAVALENIFDKLGIEAILYCGVDIPNYIKYIDGWDRVSKDIPNNFDASILVDVSTMTLFEKLSDTDIRKLSSKPSIVIDHHTVSSNPVTFSDLQIIDNTNASTGQLIYSIGKKLKWPMDKKALELIANTILGDTQGLTNDLATADTYRIMAELIEAGVNRPELENKRKEFNKMTEAIFEFKADLMKKTHFAYNNKISHVTISQSEINQYSPSYNPSALVLPEMLQTEDVVVAIAFKEYDDGRITAAIRCNPGAAIANQLADHFGGGGHTYASGFKVTNMNIDNLRKECLDKAQELLIKL